jgi:multimeric flavodoxin WrbA
MNVSGCRACGQCYTKNGHACCFDDDFDKVAPALIAADAIVIAAPLYWLSFPAKMKAIIDKWTALASVGKDFTGKTSALIACCTNPNVEVFQGMVYCYEQSMRLMNCRSVGEVLIAGVQNIGDIQKTDGEKQAAELVDQLF